MACAPSRSHARKSSGMSTSRMTSRQSGKMSGAHGTNSGNPNKGLHSSGGNNQLCKGEARFSSGIKKPGGPREL
jgi:hypothetical protein